MSELVGSCGAIPSKMPDGEENLFFCSHTCCSTPGEGRFPGHVRRSFWSRRAPRECGVSRAWRAVRPGWAWKSPAITSSHPFLESPALGLPQPRIRGSLWLCLPLWPSSVRSSSLEPPAWVQILTLSLCPPQNSYFEVLTPRTSKCDYLKTGGLKS